MRALSGAHGSVCVDVCVCEHGYGMSVCVSACVCEQEAPRISIIAIMFVYTFSAQLTALIASSGSMWVNTQASKENEIVRN